MSTLEERLREEMARSVAGVRPAPDPFGRLLRRRRRGLRRWAGAGIGAVVVATLLGTQALTASGPSPAPAPAPSYFTPAVGLDRWSRQVIDAPTRGNLAGERGLVEALRTALDGARARWAVDPALDRVKVLFLALDDDGERSFGAAYYNDERAMYVGAWAPAEGPIADLVSARYGGRAGDVSPFMWVGRHDRLSGVIAPPGCEVQYSTTTTVHADGTLVHSWTRGGGEWTANPSSNLVWQVTCDGVVRVHVSQYVTPPPPRPSLPPAERGSADPKTAEQTVSWCGSVPGLEVRSTRVLWGGTPAGEGRPSVVALGVLDGGAVEVCAATGTGDAIEIGAVSGEPPSARLGRNGLARLTKAFAASDRLVVVRLPHEQRLQLGDRLLVIAPPDATRLRVTGARDPLVTLTGGVGVIDAPLPATLTVDALDASGATVAATRFAEPRGFERFSQGEQYVWNWD
ncbi:hypothetical protein ACQP2P_12760 [Dactylosporangium sp. CA-139114]|uniref:hypothetical protein n=1 Tax=Dactylosporangium sp. CA-139114 TaxID=3239931 RepID=UPI003D9566F7